MVTSTPAAHPSGWIELPCTCANLRRLARLSTRLYQEELRQCDMDAGQLTLLASVRRFPAHTQIELANGLGLEPSVMRRNLAVFVRRGWVKKSVGTDKRDRVFRLTRKGEQQLQRARPYWHRAQERFTSAIGATTAHALTVAVAQATVALRPLLGADEGDAASL